MLTLLSLFSSPQFLLFYLILALMAAIIGIRRATGFWMTFLIALLITPVLAIILMMIFKSKQPRD
jgi:hypothetical protein